MRWGGGRAQWPTKSTTSTLSKVTGRAGGQSPSKPTQGSSNIRGRGIRDEQGEEQPPPRLPPRENGRGGRNGNAGDDGDDDNDEDEDDEHRKSLRVKVEKIQMHFKVEMYQENQEEEVVVMDHHLIQGLEMWDLEVEGDIEVREDEEGGQVHRVYRVYKDLRDHEAHQVLGDHWLLVQ